MRTGAGTSLATVRARVEAVDLLRGLLMILMALDHARDFFSGAGVNPTDALKSWPALFATRWVTHLCAPGFVALAGTSVYLQRERGKSRGAVARLLLTRGLWLIFLEMTLISFLWSLTVWEPFFQVIWAVGVGMIVLAGLQWLPVKVVGAVGVAIVVLHELLDGVKAAPGWANVWALVHQPGFLRIDGKVAGFVAYPALPWVGAICLGYAFGPMVVAKLSFWKRALPGVLLLAAFAVLRVASGYGDATRWKPLGTFTQSAMSFMNVQKYPPSLEYYLATFGVLLILYAALDVAVERDWLGGVRSFVKTYGEVPFFYYVLHIALLRVVMVSAAAAMGLDWRVFLEPRLIVLGGAPAGWGFGLPVVYLVWAGVVVGLYWPCRWFARVKRERRDWWLSYL
jgi:uncharacterized membrane protein